MRGRIILLTAGLSLATACNQQVQGTGDGTEGDGTSNGDTPPKAARTKLDSAKYCNLVVNQCQVVGTTINECVDLHDLVRVSADCAARVDKATCDDILDITSLCFPPCSTSANTCNDDGTLTSCSDAVTVTLSCADGCHSNGASYSGTCGTKDPNTGEVSEIAKCWCE